MVVVFLGGAGIVLLAVELHHLALHVLYPWRRRRPVDARTGEQVNTFAAAPSRVSSGTRPWSAITRQMRAIYEAPTVEAAEADFAAFTDTWSDIYPAMISSWERAWDELVPFLAFPVELRKIVYTTNAIESLNARSEERSNIEAISPTSKPR